MRYIKVGLPRTPLPPLTYSVPDHFPDPVPGMRVVVSLANRFVTGFVIETNAAVESDLEIKPILDLVDSEVLFSPVLLKLTQWMAEYYLAHWVDILKSALPPAMDVKAETLISITPEGQEVESDSVLLERLKERKAMKLKKIYELLGHRGTFAELKRLEVLGFLEISAEYRRRRRGYNMVELAAASQEPAAPKERELYEYLREIQRPVWTEDLREKFKTASILVRKMAQRGQLRCFWMPAAPKSIWPELQQIEQLNAAQKRAYQEITRKKDQFGVFLLHGVTGSGKTEVYLRLAQDVLAGGKSVLILVPEIALLPLIVHRAEQTIRRPISVLHSELTERERMEEWQKAKRSEVRLVVGARSAIFAPLQNLGLIVMDEEHDGSYKQNEYPRYHARECAIMRASFEGCPIVLGSATPALESHYNAKIGKYTYLSLPHRVENRPMPEVRLIDMKVEYRETGNAMFSRLLLENITDCMDRKEQALILQNRRGYASLMMCRDCGYVMECPHCSVTLTYHKLARKMVCHYCDYSRLVPGKCEKCGSAFLHFAGVGTEKIVESLRQSYPSARIERFDRDATRGRGAIARILTKFASQEIDILVGTQMLAKGHDFPNVTLVGVIGADSAIGIPDFRAAERLFQLITQVAGRSGRGDAAGQVILQTFHPDHYAIRCSLDHSYSRFYETEIRFRRLMQYPPYVSLANLIFAGKEAPAALHDAREFGKFILAFKTEPMKMLGPAVAPIARLSGLYRYQILLKSPSRKDLRTCLHSAIHHYEKAGKHKSQYSIDIDPTSIS